MATATGKTPVMAMLILSHTANHRNAAPDDHRFTRRFLVITPGLTVRERLQDSLDPAHDDSDWKAFNLVPPGDQWEKALSSASVNVINYHQMQPKDVEPTSTKQQQLIDGGSDPTTQQELEARKETPRDVIDRIADGKSQQGRIPVINDEGHHCHRGDPDRRNASTQDTQWFQGIQQIRDAGMLQYVVDMSATPIFLAQSNPRPHETASTSAVRAPDWRWGFERRLPHPFREARTPGSRQGDSSLAHSWAFEIAQVARRRVAMLAPALDRAAR